jgi:hypothetical protein
MLIKRLLSVAFLGLSLVAVGCTAEVEDAGEAPSVDVDPGQAPSIDVDPARVEVGTDTQTVVTPDVDITPTTGDDAEKN